jgi:hypothetical protein
MHPSPTPAPLAAARPLAVLVSLFLAVAPLAAHPQTPTPVAEAPALASLDWLIGSWTGSVGENSIEEVWLPPVGGAMAGLFRWSKGGQVYLYELMTLEEAEGSVVLKIKHFGPGLMGWEDKAASVVFDRVEATADRAAFAKRGGTDGARSSTAGPRTAAWR